MGMTMTQKILAAHAGLAEVKAGQLIEADLDLVLGNDITSPVAINEMKKMDNQSVFDKDKIALVMDHFIPNKDIKSAENCKCCREFACRHDITNYFDVGEMGIEHALLPEQMCIRDRFRTMPWLRSIRLDVYNVDDKNRIYDAEVISVRYRDMGGYGAKHLKPDEQSRPVR